MSAENIGTEWAAEELEMVCLAVAGVPNLDIGYKLGRSESTTKNRIKRVLTELGLKNKRQLAILLIQRGEDGSLSLRPEIASELSGSIRELIEGLLDGFSERALVAKKFLSKRETQVLRLLMRGMSGEEIASVLSIEESTVKGHLRQIMAKAEVGNRAQACLVGYAMGVGP